jgi:hypothetical protein
MQKIYFVFFCVVSIINCGLACAQQHDSTKATKTINDTLMNKTKELKEVIIFGVKNKYIEYQLYKTVVRADALISATGGNATDILNASPGVTIDENGKISLKGKDGAVIYVNDRPVRLSGTDLLNYLKSLPATMIDKVELLSNPSARYNADGAAIINIKTKKLTNNGFNGTLSSSAGFGKYFRANTGALLNYRLNHFNFFMNAGYTATNGYFESNRRRDYSYPSGNQGYSLLQHVVEISHDGNINYQTGIDYDINRYTSMSLVTDGLVDHYREHGQYENQYMNVMAMQDSVMISDSRYKNQSQRNSFNYNFRHAFNGGKKELNIYLDHLSFTPHSDQTLLSNIYYAGNALPDESALLTKYIFAAHIYSAKADYSDTIFKTVKIEQGIQTLYSQRDNSSRYLTQNSNGALGPDQLLNNSFRYCEAIQAAYINLEHHSKKVSLQAGLRLENTSGNATQYAMASKPDTSFSMHYTNLFPTGYFVYKPDSNGKHIFSLSAGRRIERPDYNDLNPSAFYFDKSTSLRGNSLLQPAFSTNLELSYVYNNSMSATFTYANSKGFITSGYKQVGAAFITVPVNVNHYNSIVAALTWPLRITHWWKLNLYPQLERRQFRGSLFDASDYTNEHLTTLFMKTYSQFNWKKNWSADLTTTYRSKIVTWQSNLEPVFQVHAGIQKKINNYSTITLSGNDIFHTNIIKRHIDILYAHVYYKLMFDTQRFMISYRYRFGNASGGRSRKTGIEEEAGRAH